MRRALLLSVLLCSLLLSPHGATAQAPVQRGNLRVTTVVDWQAGTAEAVQITNNDNGELRLADGQIEGVYTSGVIRTDFPASALGATWQASIPAEAELRLEARGGPSEDQLGDWQALLSGDARSQSNDTDGAFASEAPVPLTAGSQFIEFRATLVAKALNASPVLSELVVNYFDASAGPALGPGLIRVPAPFGPTTLTAAPLIIQRTDWSGSSGGARIARQTPRGIILHQIGSDSLGDNPLPFLRAVASYQTEVLGWDDVAYHFIISGAGDVLQGHAGGPAASIPRFANGDDAVHIALVGSGAATEAQSTLR